MDDNNPVMLIDRDSDYPVVVMGDGADARDAAMRYAAILDKHRDAIRANAAARNRRERRFTRAAQAAP